MSLIEVLSVLSIHLLAVISPGPDFFMLLKNTLTYSRKTGIYTAVGFGLGIGVHVSYSLLGLNLLIKNSELLYQIITYMGAAYLAYIGIMSLISKTTAIEQKAYAHRQDISPLKAIRIGFITNVLNPKATLFFISLFTLVVSPEASRVAVTGIGIAMMINTSLWFSLLAVMVSHNRIMPFLNKHQRKMNIIFGIILIGFSVKVSLGV